MIQLRQCRHGRMLYLPNDRYTGRSLHASGETHAPEARFLCGLVGAGDVVVDAGANIGVLTVPLAQKVGPDGYVVAVEPQDHLFHTLCGNLALNGLRHVAAMQRAAAERGGRVAYLPEIDYDAEENFGGVCVSSDSSEHCGRRYSRPVVTVAIDELRLVRLSLLKVDVEGMEAAVLCGAVETIMRTRPLLWVEFMGDRVGVLRFLKDARYDWRLLETPYTDQPDDIFVSDDGSRLVSSDLFCWPSEVDYDAPLPFAVDLDGSVEPRHRAAARAVEEVYGH